MEVVNKNVSQKDMIGVLKSIQSSSTNKHEDKEMDSLILSVIMISTKIGSKLGNETNITVNAICVEKKSGNIFDDILVKEFDNEDNATKYYNELKDKLFFMSEEQIYNLLNENTGHNLSFFSYTLLVII